MVYSPLVKTYIHHRIPYINICVYSNGEYTIYQLVKYIYIYMWYSMKWYSGYIYIYMYVYIYMFRWYMIRYNGMNIWY